MIKKTGGKMSDIEKLMKLKEYDDGTSFWRIACDCSEPNHDVQLWFDIEDEEYPYMNLNMTMEIGAYSKWHDAFYKRWWWRIKSASQILFTGHYTMTGDVILDKDGVAAMQTALAEGIKIFKKGEEIRKKRQEENKKKITKDTND